MKKEHLEIARILYKPSKRVESLTLQLCDLFDKPLPNGVTITSLTFKKGHLTIGELDVKEVRRVNYHCGVEIHWYPNFSISTKRDPYCSAFVLKYNSLEKLYKEVNKALCTLAIRN